MPEILIVEDERPLAGSLARALEARGYRTRQAHDGEEALREVGRAAPDLVLLDLLLPRKDGPGVLAVLRESRETREIPVIAMSGVLRGREHERELVAAGARALLAKPFPVSRLLDLLREHLAARPETALPPERFDLAQQTVAEVLWPVMQSGFSGAVHFRADRKHKELGLVSGGPAWIRSNSVRECLGRRLLDTGRIDEETHLESFRRAGRSERRQGEILVRMGILTGEELAQAQVAQAEARLVELFTWTRGEAWLQAGVREAPLASALEGWSPRRTILAGVERMDRRCLEERLRPHADAPVTRREVQLTSLERTPAVAALLDRLGPGQAVAELIPEHAPALYALELIGALDLGGKAEATHEGEASSLAGLRALGDRQASQSCFEVLGVPEGASPAEIRGAFLGLARRYHPDRFAADGGETRALAARVFARISEAHDTLSDPEQREACRSGRRGDKGGAEAGEVARILSAERESRRGESLLRGRRLEAALDCFARAVELDPEEGEFLALHAWTLFLLRRDDAGVRVEAARSLERARALAPRSPAGYYYAGLVCKACGEAAGAERMFRKALEVSPGHVEATRELRLCETRRRDRGMGAPGGRRGRGGKRE